jgi:hypothetical protein
MDSLEMEAAAFRRMRPRLLRSCPGEFVALYRGRVVGRGPDDEALAHEMFAKLGDVPFYIAKVEATPTVYELPSPESLR